MISDHNFKYRISALLALLLFLASQSSGHAETTLLPSILVSEEYNDNLFLTPHDSPNGEFPSYITRIAPSVLFNYSSSLWDWKFAGTYDYRYYSHWDYADNSAYTIHFAEQTRIIRNFFMLDVSDDHARVSVTPTYDYTQQSSFVNQTDQNILNVHPYFILKPALNTTINVAYAFIDTTYSNPTGTFYSAATGTFIQGPSGIDTREHVGSVELVQELSSKTTLTTALSRTRNENDANSFVKQEATVEFGYEYSDSSRVSAMVGYDIFNPDTGVNVREPIWDLRGLHKLPTVSFEFEMAFHFIPDPLLVVRREYLLRAGLNKTTERTSLSVSGGVRRYRSGQQDYLQSTVYSLAGTFSHKVFEQTRLSYGLSIDRNIDNTNNDAYTTTYLTDIRFEQTIFENLVWALEYRYGDAYSPDIYANNYRNNRITLEVSKHF